MENNNGCNNAEALSMLDTNSRTPAVNTFQGTRLFVPYVTPPTSEAGLWRVCEDENTGIKLIPSTSQCPPKDEKKS